MDKIKDFIRVTKEEDKSILTETKKKKEKQSASYNVKVVSGPDFVINKKTTRTDRDLIFIVSAKQYYIKDNIKNAELDLNSDELKKFFVDLRGEDSIKIGATSINELTRDGLSIMTKAIENSEFADFLKCAYDIERYDDLEYLFGSWSVNKKLFDEVFKLHGVPKEYGYNSIYSMEYFSALSKIMDSIGLDKIRYYLRQALGSPLYVKYINSYSGSYGYMYVTNASKKVDILCDMLKNFDYKRVCEYIFYESYCQGYTNMDNFLGVYFDTLRMQKLIYGKIKDKYPKYLATTHNILTLKYNIIKVEIEKEEFERQVKSYSHLAYKNSSYTIIIPSTPEDLADEGVALSHCVKTYVERVVDGSSKICFMRKTDDIETSLITIEIINNMINQVKGYSNRMPSVEELSFVNKWAKEKGLLLSPNIVATAA